MKNLVMLILMLIPSLTMAASVEELKSLTDYKCMTDCVNQGYQYGYCQKLCSY